ncbi:small multi-drug export protein [bacterium]|nr:small multi-drug export protein [bacterium]
MAGKRAKIALFVLIILFVSSLVASETVPRDEEALSHGDKIASWLHKKGIPSDLVVLIIAMLPIVELRGAIPVAMHLFGMSIPHSYILCVLGNMIPIPFILLLLGPVSRFLRRMKIFDKFFIWLFNRTRKRSNKIKKYEELGLIAFVAIPLPITGAWTGSLAAFLFGLRFWPSFFCALAGVCIAGVVVTAFSALGWVGAISAGVILIIIAATSIFSKKQQNNSQVQ